MGRSRRWRSALPEESYQRHALIKLFLMRNQKRTETPEEMFAPLIRKGLVCIKRRRFKQPLLIWTEDDADVKTARRRLAEIREFPERLIRVLEGMGK